MHESIRRLVTPGEIARALRQPQHRVDYVIRTRSEIVPVRRAGIIRLFDREVVAMVGRELDAIDARWTGQEGRRDE